MLGRWLDNNEKRVRILKINNTLISTHSLNVSLKNRCGILDSKNFTKKPAIHYMMRPARKKSAIYIGVGIFYQIIFAIFSLPVYAEKKLTIVTSEIPNFISEKASQKGLYNDFLDALPEQRLIFMPPSRIEVEFNKQYIDCIFPASSKGMGDTSGLIESSVVKDIVAYVFSVDEKWLERRQPAIAIRRGFDYGNVRESLNAQYVELSSDLDSIKMLASGRVDAIIGYLPEITAATALLGIPLLHYDVGKPLYIQKDAMVCHDKPSTREYIAQVNAVIAQWRQSGKLD